MPANLPEIEVDQLISAMQPFLDAKHARRDDGVRGLQLGFGSEKSRTSVFMDYTAAARLHEALGKALAFLDAQPTDSGEMLGTLQISKIDRRASSGGGSWVSGGIAGHRFEALVFPEHAEVEAYELDQSRISKFWLKNTTTGQTVANFDRGWDLRPTTDDAQQITDLLSAGLAETVFGK